MVTVTRPPDIASTATARGSTRIVATDGGWMTVPDLPVTQPVPLADVLARQYPFVASPEPDGGFGILFPDLPGCMSFADAWEDVGREAREASALWLEGEWYDNHAIPEPSYQWQPFEHDGTRPADRLDGLPEPTYEKVYTAEETAEDLGVTRNRVQQLARANGVGTKVNNARLFTASDIAVLRARPDGRRRSRPARQDNHFDTVHTEGDL